MEVRIFLILNSLCVVTFFAFFTLFVCKLLKINILLVEAAGVELVLSIENTQLIHSRNARNSQISMSAKSAYKSRTNKS